MFMVIFVFHLKNNYESTQNQIYSVKPSGSQTFQMPNPFYFAWRYENDIKKYELFTMSAKSLENSDLFQTCIINKYARLPVQPCG